MRPRRTLVLADLHLSRHTGRTVCEDFARLLSEHPGTRVVVAGDLFDLSADVGSSTAPLDRRAALDAALGAQPAVRRALASHLDRDGELWLTAGNHDAETALPSFPPTLGDALGIDARARSRVHTSPWFFRRGGLHVEHGHLYDPDNAPAHPLVVGEPSLGVHFVEQFIAPTGAFVYLNRNDETPLALFLSAFTQYGRRGPHVVYRYFRAAFQALARSGPGYRARDEEAVGHARMDGFAQAQSLPPEVPRAVFDARALPTLESARRTFQRLYFDRVFATVALAAGASLVASGARTAGAVSLATGALVMASSWAKGHDRYGGSVHERLLAGARRVREASGAKLVVLGHTHREAQCEGYANTGSFSFPHGAPGRPFLEIEGDEAAPRAARRHLRAA